MKPLWEGRGQDKETSLLSQQTKHVALGQNAVAAGNQEPSAGADDSFREGPVTKSAIKYQNLQKE